MENRGEELKRATANGRNVFPRRRSFVAVALVSVVIVLVLEVGLLVLLTHRGPQANGARALVATSATSTTASGAGSGQVVETTSVAIETTSVAIETTTTDAAIPARQTIGTSVQGRPIELYTFGRGQYRVLIIGGVHGDEYGGPVAAAFLAYLQQHPESVPTGTFVQVIPCANPDGQAAKTRGNANKVDINRNFPTKDWKSKLNSGDRPTVGLSGGPSPASEPETQALLTVLDDGWDLVIALHSHGGIIDPDGGGQAIAKRMSYVSGLPVSGLYYQSYITGSLGLFMPERYEVPVITVELRSTKLSSGIRRALLVALKPG